MEALELVAVGERNADVPPAPVVDDNHLRRQRAAHLLLRLAQHRTKPAAGHNARVGNLAMDDFRNQLFRLALSNRWCQPSFRLAYHIRYWYSIRYNGIMKPARKITVEVPAELLEKAQRAGGTGVTQTVRTGLQLVAASHAYARLRQLRGKIRFSRTLAELKADR